MARATKRTTALLMTVAIVFIIVIIILCLVPQPCRVGDDCYLEGTERFGATKAPVVGDGYTSTSSITSSSSTTTSSTTTTSTTASSTTTMSTTTPRVPPSTTTSTTPSTPETSTSSSSVASDSTSPVSESVSSQSSTTESVTSSQTSTQTTDAETTSPVSGMDTTVASSITTDHGTEAETTESATDALTTELATTESATEPETTEMVTEADTTTAPVETTTAGSTTETTTGVMTTTEHTFTYMRGSECNTTACRRLAARMLDMMDLGDVDPCVDFYQYSCGGVVDDPFLDPEDPKFYASAIIKGKLDSLLPNDTDAGEAKVFYDGCLNYTGQTEAERLSKARKVFLSLGYRFDITGLVDDPNDEFDLTHILAALMKMHFTPLFDLTLDVDGENPSSFVLRLSPPVFTSPFSDDLAHSVCVGEYNVEAGAAKVRGGELNLDMQYQKYSECMRKGNGLKAFISRIKEPVRTMKLMENITGTQLLDGLAFNLNFLLEDILSKVPEKPETRKRYLNKDYEQMTLEALMAIPEYSSGIKWDQLVNELMGRTMDPKDVKVQVYFKDELAEVLRTITEEYDLDPMNLQNMILLWWSDRVYSDLVRPHGVAITSPSYCLRVTTRLMQDFASFMYLDGLQDRDDIKTQIDTMVRLTKTMAEEQLQRTFPPPASNAFLEKLHKMTGETPDIEIARGVIRKNMVGVNITGNFTDDCVTLMKRFRELMYRQYVEDPSDPNVMWSQFLLPFNSYGTFVYAINKFLIPYGAVAPPLFFKDVPQYVNFAGLGHMVAHELMHSFDAAGIQYDGNARNTIPEAVRYQPTTECLLEQLGYTRKINTSANLDTVFTLHHGLAVNELLSDSAATRLAWEAYLASGGADVIRRRRSVEGGRDKRQAPSSLPSIISAEPTLPYLGLSPVQIYFLRTAQTQCSSTSDIMFTVKEDEHLPARLRVNLVLQNEPLFAAAFHCPQNSPMIAMSPCGYTLG